MKLVKLLDRIGYQRTKQSIIFTIIAVLAIATSVHSVYLTEATNPLWWGSWMFAWSVMLFATLRPLRIMYEAAGYVCFGVGFLLFVGSASFASTEYIKPATALVVAGVVFLGPIHLIYGSGSKSLSKRGYVVKYKDSYMDGGYCWKRASNSKASIGEQAHFFTDLKEVQTIASFVRGLKGDLMKGVQFLEYKRVKGDWKFVNVHSYREMLLKK
ncbi:MAG: hypothetical protein ACPGO5_05420 [Patescibacteria group bacterium]